MVGLGCTMRNKIDGALVFDEIRKPFAISYVELVMRQSPSILAQPLKIPRRVTFWIKKSARILLATPITRVARMAKNVTSLDPIRPLEPVMKAFVVWRSLFRLS
jgi:hypothetical protein